MKLMEKPGYETIIGDGRHLTEYIKNLIEQGRITESKAMSIKDNLKNSFDGGHVKEEQLIVKAHEMFSDFQYEYEWFFGNVLANDEICPICFEKMDYEEGICHNCAFEVGMVDLNLKNFQDMHQFAEFVESHRTLRETRDIYLEKGYSGDHLYTDLLFETYLDDALKIEYDDLNLNKWVDLDEMYGIEEIPEENNHVIHVSEIESYKIDQIYKYRLIPRNYDSYVMPVELNKFQLFSSVEKYNDVDLILEELYIAPYSLSKQLIDSSFNEGYLTHNACKANWVDFSQYVSVDELRLFLKIHDKDSSGSRDELISRIYQSDLQLDYFISEKIFLTQNAYDYLNDNEWIGFYWNHLYNYDFFDFEDYFENNDGNVEEISLKYLDEHIKLTQMSSDFDYIMKTYLVKSNICHKTNNLKEALVCDIRMFILNMNPVCFDMSISLRFCVPFFPVYVTHLKKLKLEFGEEVILNSFNENWNFMNYDTIMIPKDDVKNILIAALDTDDYISWGNKVYDEYFAPFFGIHNHKKI